MVSLNVESLSHVACWGRVGLGSRRAQQWGMLGWGSEPETWGPCSLGRHERKAGAARGRSQSRRPGWPPQTSQAVTANLFHEGPGGEGHSGLGPGAPSAFPVSSLSGLGRRPGKRPKWKV